MNILGPVMCMFIMFLLYMNWRNGYVFHLQMKWASMVLLASLVDLSDTLGKPTYETEKMLNCVFNSNKMMLHFWLFGIDAMVEDREVYNWVNEKYDKAAAMAKAKKETNNGC